MGGETREREMEFKLQLELRQASGTVTRPAVAENQPAD
jgi:hypothetical protein